MNLEQKLISKNIAVEEFENLFKEYYEFPYAFCTSSASVAYFILSFTFNKSIKFYTTPITWLGTIWPFFINNFKVKFLRFKEYFYNIINFNSSKNKIINLCFWRGVPYPSSYLKEMKREKCLLVIDNSQGFGSIDEEGEPAGKEADILIFSLGIGKDLDLGGGGIILLKDFEIYEKIIYFSEHPIIQEKILKKNPSFHSINFKINVEAAKKGIKRFKNSIKKVRRRQEKTQEILDNLEKEGFIKKYPKNVIPSFWKEILCLWNGKMNWADLNKFLKGKYKNYSLEPFKFDFLGDIYNFLNKNVKNSVRKYFKIHFILKELK